MSKTELNFYWRIKENSIGSTLFRLKTTNIIYGTIKKILHNLCVLEPVLKHKIKVPSPQTHEVKAWTWSIMDLGAQWLSGRVLDSRPRGRGFKPHRCHCIDVLGQDTIILA